jgi:hypothetical protein
MHICTSCPEVTTRNTSKHQCDGLQCKTMHVNQAAKNSWTSQVRVSDRPRRHGDPGVHQTMHYITLNGLSRAQERVTTQVPASTGAIVPTFA